MPNVIYEWAAAAASKNCRNHSVLFMDFFFSSFPSFLFFYPLVSKPPLKAAKNRVSREPRKEKYFFETFPDTFAGFLLHHPRHELSITGWDFQSIFSMTRVAACRVVFERPSTSWNFVFCLQAFNKLIFIREILLTLEDRTYCRTVAVLYRTISRENDFSRTGWFILLADIAETNRLIHLCKYFNTLLLIIFDTYWSTN